MTTRVRIDQVRRFYAGTYEPTPVRDPMGRSNYVDSDRIDVALRGS